ncbi:MAG: hypothetical protein ACW992_13415 [Candidatus Thorarchaeota archaeon]
MEAIIESMWQILYSNNPKIQAFAVCKDSVIVWQTSNWDPAKNVANVLDAVTSAGASVTLNKVKYDRISSNAHSYVATNGQGQGHFLSAQVEKGVWLLAWAAPDSTPELAVVDLLKTGVDLRGQI